MIKSFDVYNPTYDDDCVIIYNNDLTSYFICKKEILKLKLNESFTLYQSLNWNIPRFIVYLHNTKGPSMTFNGYYIDGKMCLNYKEWCIKKEQYLFLKRFNDKLL